MDRDNNYVNINLTVQNCVYHIAKTNRTSFNYKV